MSVGSLGQKPGWEVPPPEEQLLVEMQVPGAPFAVQAPFRAPKTEGIPRRRKATEIIELLLLGERISRISGSFGGVNGLYIPRVPFLFHEVCLRCGVVL